MTWAAWVKADAYGTVQLRDAFDDRPLDTATLAWRQYVVTNVIRAGDGTKLASPDVTVFVHLTRPAPGGLWRETAVLAS